jgi:peptidoglycan/xylan/chitin deacetylase (PgdA/CDA1 family)
MTAGHARTSPGHVVAVTVAGTRAGALVRTVDSLCRQSRRPLIAIAAVESARREILQSLSQRTGALVAISPRLTHAVNAAASSRESDWLLLLPAGVRLESHAIECCIAELESSPTLAAVAPAVREESPDGVRWQVRRFGDLGSVALFEEPAAAPPVVYIRRSAWDREGGLDEQCQALAIFDLLLRLQSAGDLRGIPDVLAAREVSGPRGWTEIWPRNDRYLDALAYVIEKNRTTLEPVTRDLLLRREARLVAMRDAHRDLVRRRDEDLERLEDARAEIAHARAYLRHHGEDQIDWGDFRRTDPVDRDWGYARGTPVDRYYIDAFLAAHSSDVRGAVLEVQENDLTLKFGASRVHSSSVVDLDESNPRATHLADLRCAPHIASESFDCIILTQTLHVIDDVDAVLAECRRLLRPDGVLLATMPSASRVCLEYGTDGDLWRATPAGGRALFEKTFGPGAVDVSTFGNVLTNVAFLEGLACTDLAPQEFDVVDPYYPALVGVRARKHRPQVAGRVNSRAVLMYHRVAGDTDVHGLAVAPQHFEDHLAMLARDFRVLPLDELLGTPVRDLPPRAVALTFDDGYLDNLEYVAPALERAGLPATFFLTTRWLDQPGEYWWDTLERVLLFGESLPGSIELPGPTPLRFETATVEQRRAAHDTLHGMLVRATLDAREQMMGAIARLGGPPPRRRPVVADEVAQLARMPGASVAAHTVNHLSLADQSPDVVGRELEECRVALERITGRTIQEFAYPYGAASRASADAVRSRFRWGLSCVEGPIGASFDTARAGRVEVRNWTAAQLSETLDRVFVASAR